MAVSLDPFRNIVNVKWGGGILIIKASFHQLWYGRDPRFPGLHDEEIPFGSDPWVTDKLEIPWRVFCRVMEPLDASGMIPQITVGKPIGTMGVVPNDPHWYSYGEITGNYKWLSWNMEQYEDYQDSQGAPVPESEFLPVGLDTPIEELPWRAPYLFLPNRLKGIQCGYISRVAYDMSISLIPPTLTVATGTWALRTELIWTVNLNLLPPPFTPEEIAFRFRLDFVRNPVYPGSLSDGIATPLNVEAGMFIPPEKATRPTEGDIHGTIEPCEQNNLGPGIVTLDQSGAVLDLLVLRGEPWTGGPPKILMVRQV